MMRFYAMVVLLFSFVFLYIPRVDFFLCSVLFLLHFITMFYLDDPALLVRMLFYLPGRHRGVCLWFMSGHPGGFWTPALPYASDWLTLVFIVLYDHLRVQMVRNRPRLRKKYRPA
jgi:hypothetical protein